jgi:hypothetical protein
MVFQGGHVRGTRRRSGSPGGVRRLRVSTSAIIFSSALCRELRDPCSLLRFSSTLLYGAFAGRERITELIDVWFYKDAEDFRWNMS